MSHQINLFDITAWLKDGKGILAGSTGVAAAISIATAMLLPPIFTARTTVLPPGTQQQGGAAGALAALGALGGGALSALGGKTPDELYVALLKSDSILRVLDEKFNLRQRYNEETFEQLRRKITDHIKISNERKTGVITIEVDDEDPVFAAELANEHPTQLDTLLGRIAITDSQQRLAFFEKQLSQTKTNLLNAEVEYQIFSKQSGIIALDKQAQSLIETVANLKTKITASEINLKVLLNIATPQNRDVIQTKLEIAALKEELSKVESSSKGGISSLPAARLPETTTEFIRAQRELKFQEAMLEGMLKQYEASRLDAASDGPSLQIVDKALPPDRKSKPPRGLIIIIGIVMGFIMGSIFIISKQYITQTRRAQEN